MNRRLERPDTADAVPDVLKGPLIAALEHSEQVVGLFDPDDLLCWANAKYRRMFLRGLALPAPFAEVLRHGFHHGFGVKIDSGDVEQFLRDVLARRRRQLFRAFQTDTVDGHWLWMTETMHPDGWLLSVASDITALKRHEHRLRQARDHALQASLTDTLTGMPNRRHILDLGAAMLVDCRERREPFTLAVLDLDHFKRINDTYGHAAGDDVLRHFGAHCRHHLRPGDTLGRVGGEEFLLLLPGAELGAADVVVERLRRHLIAPNGLHYTFSAGLAQARAGEALGPLIVRADRALYAAKESGRSCSVTSPMALDEAN